MRYARTPKTKTCRLHDEAVAGDDMLIKDASNSLVLHLRQLVSESPK